VGTPYQYFPNRQAPLFAVLEDHLGLRTCASQTAQQDDQRSGGGVGKAIIRIGTASDAGVSTRDKDFTRRIRHTDDAGRDVLRDARAGGEARLQKLGLFGPIGC